MEPQIKKRFVFVSKSMLWSLLLYVTLMLVFNWDDVSNAVKGQHGASIVNTITGSQKDANINARGGVAKGIATLVKMLSGVSVLVR